MENYPKEYKFSPILISRGGLFRDILEEISWVLLLEI